MVFLCATTLVAEEPILQPIPNTNPPPIPLVQTASYEVGALSTVTTAQIEQAIAELEQVAEISAEAKQQTVENYQAALKNLQSATDHDNRLKTLTAEAELVGSRTSDLREQLAELKDKKAAVDAGLPLSELEQLLPTTELQLSGFKKARQDAEAELQSRATRRKEIRARLTTIQEKDAEAEAQIRTLTTAESTPQSQSMVARLVTRRTMLGKERPLLEAELAKYDAEEAANSVRLRLEVAAANAAYCEKMVGLLQDQINAARELAAEEAVRKARSEAISAAPALKVYAEENQQLAETSKAIAADLADTDADLKASNETHEDLLRKFAQTRKKVDAVGLTSSIGALLRKERTTLPNVESRRIAVNQRQKLISDTQYQLFEYEEQQQELAEADDVIAEILATAKQQSAADKAVLEAAIGELIERKREYLDDLVRCTGQYFDKLIELDTLDRQIIKLEADYENYIDQRVLWIRSGQAITAGIKIQDSDTWMLSTRRWKEVAVGLAHDARQQLVTYIACMVLIGMLWYQGRSLRKTIRELGETAEKANCRSIMPTLHAIVLTAVVSMTWPLVCVFVGWRLKEVAGDSQFTRALADGFMAVATLLLSIEVIRQLCRAKGVGESHFRWPTHVLSLVRRKSRHIIAFVLPTAFATVTLASSDDVHQRGDLQRLTFILGMSMMGWVVFGLLRPSGVLREFFAAHNGGLIAKLKYLVTLVGMALPMSLAVLAAAGYFYTAQALAWRLFATCMFVASLVVVRALLYRMLLLRRRALSMEQARQRAAAAREIGETASEKLAGIVTENSQADITAHSLQSRNLVSTAVSALAIVGMWMIWIGVLPALSMVGNYPLWGSDAAMTLADPAAPTIASPMSLGGVGDKPVETVAENQRTPSRSVKVADVALAILIAVVTAVLFRNGPGLLEISILQQLPLDASVRYAITTLVSYAIVMIGTIAACSTVGLQWSQIQWLVTALTFGLAFGLQEMFANFVAGLIILLERPIRVGDIVTVDDVTGVVSRIRIRATSITNWDRKEYVVPNKEFITGRLLNWTLSDKVNRIVVEVGLAYGSDTERARELLLQSANNHPIVLKDPAAMATFEGFGDNSLNLVLRAFLPSLENRLQVIHELHTAIDQAFRRENIEIAFPQRDLHIRTMSTVPFIQANGEEAAKRSREAA